MTIVYFVLRHLTNLTGWDLVADVILHYVMPILFVIDWLFLVPRKTLKSNDTFSWLAYPIVYLVWTFIHGAYSGFYPYPFLNNSELGIARVLLNEASLLIVFLIRGLYWCRWPIARHATQVLIGSPVWSACGELFRARPVCR